MQVQLTKPNIFQRNMAMVVRTQTEVSQTREGGTAKFLCACVLIEAQIKREDFNPLG